MTLVDDDTNSIIADTVNPNNTWIDREMHNVDKEITKGVGRQGGVLWSFKDGDHRTLVDIDLCATIFSMISHEIAGFSSVSSASGPATTFACT